jgi:hypothetical protein
MPPLDEHVRGSDDAAVSGADNSRVVTDADNEVGAGGKRLSDGGDQRELAIFRDGDESSPALSRRGPALLRSRPLPTVALRSH